MIYAVTDRRVVSVLQRRWLPDAVRGMYLTTIPRITTHGRRSGKNTVLFGDASRDEPFTWLTQPGDALTGVGFYNLEDAQTIADLVETTRERYALHA